LKEFLHDSRVINWSTCFLLLLHVLLWLLLLPTVEEDAFISDGWGYVFNIGGERVEAGTSPIWVLLLALFIKLPLSPILVMKLLGLVCNLLTVLIAGRITFTLTNSANAKLLAMATIVISYPLVYWADQGLETPLVALLLMANLLCMVDLSWRRGLWLSCILLILVRPEGPIYLIVVLCWGLWQRYQGDRIAQRDVCVAVLFATLALAACTAWRLWYFGDFVVQPFYFKSSNIGAAVPIQLLFDVNHNLRLDLILTPIVTALLFRKLPSSAWVLAIPFILQLMWYIHLTDHFPFDRHLVPGLAPLLTLSIVAWWSLARHKTFGYRRLVWGVAIAIPIFTVIQYQQNPLIQFGRLFFHEPVAYIKSTAQRLINPEVLAPDLIDANLRGQPNILALGHNWEVGPGKFLAGVYPRGSIIAYHEMGQTAYYAGQDKQFIDTAGLVTRRIGFYKFSTSFDERPMARRLWNARCDVLSMLHRDECPSLSLEETLNYILDKHPDVVMTHTIVAKIYGENLPPFALLQDDRFKRRYQKRYIVDGMIQVYERKDKNFPLFEGNIPGVEIQRIP
jgi:hypothetical protein